MEWGPHTTQPETAHKGSPLLLPRKPFSFTCSMAYMNAEMLDKECYPNKLWLWALENGMPIYPGQNHFCQAEAFHWYSYMANPKSHASGLHSNSKLLGHPHMGQAKKNYTLVEPRGQGYLNFSSSFYLSFPTPPLFSLCLGMNSASCACKSRTVLMS